MTLLTLTTRRAARFCAVIVSCFALGGCFIATKADREAVIAGLGPASWPIPSGTYLEDGQTEGFAFQRLVRDTGERAYVSDEDPEDVNLFYRIEGNLYIFELLDLEQQTSTFSFVTVSPEGTVGSNVNTCNDLSVDQRQALFGDDSLTTCPVTTTDELLNALRLSREADPEVEAIYRLTQPLPDAG